jgi:hypothetical protein
VTGYALPRVAITAHLALTKGEPRAGEIFVFERVPHHTGPETPLEMLNRPEGFFPFKVHGTSAVLLVTKAHTIQVTVAHAAPISDPERLSAAKMIHLEVVLADGATLTGIAAFEAPAHHSRVLDYLNATQEPFFAVSTATDVHYVNRSHVLFARPQE